MERKTHLLHIFLILGCCALTVYLGSQLKSNSPDGDHYLNPPPEHIELFHFGFRDSIADSLWLRWIQDNDTCQRYGAAVQTLAPDPNADTFASPRHKICDNSWSFRMLDAITKLSPDFRMPYLAGGITLAVLVEDYEGASTIIDRGVEAFPDDWQMLYRAAFHYLFDREDLPKAAALMVRAQHAGAPKWLSLLAAKLYSKSGRAELGIATLENYKKTITSPEGIKVIDEKIAALKKQLEQ